MPRVEDVPDDVVEHLRSIFSGCNARTTEKLSNNPNVPEESLDLSWIEHMTRHSAVAELPSAWLVKIETHYLGGMRHFYRWEIADIGVLVHLRLASGRQSKVALLQSKRLYTNAAAVREETPVDFEIGLARLADPEDDALSMALQTDFRFDEDCAYNQITPGSGQVERIDEYERDVKLKVYYHLYNPWSIPFEQRIPLAQYVDYDGHPDIGVRVIHSRTIHARLDTESRHPPRLGDLEALEGLPPYGRRLEEFVCDELLACREGDRFQSIGDDRIQALFNRRSGAIAAAIAITIEAPQEASA